MKRRSRDAAPRGAIFALKNFGWREKQDMDLSGDVKVKTLADLMLDAANWKKEKKSVEA